MKSSRYSALLLIVSAAVFSVMRMGVGPSQAVGAQTAQAPMCRTKRGF